jgi:hypothetical protein
LVISGHTLSGAPQVSRKIRACGEKFKVQGSKFKVGLMKEYVTAPPDTKPATFPRLWVGARPGVPAFNGAGQKGDAAKKACNFINLFAWFPVTLYPRP